MTHKEITVWTEILCTVWKFVSLKAMSEESSGVASAMKTGNETSSVSGKFKYNS